MKSFITLALATAVAAKLLERDVPTVLADLDAIKSDIGTLQTAIGSYNTFDDAQTLLSAEKAVEDAITKANTDAQNTNSVSDAEAVQVLTNIKGLIPNVVSAVNAATGKYSVFQSTGVGAIVAGRLTVLQSLTDGFATTLLGKAPASAQDAGNAAKGCIDSIFAAGIATPPTQANDCSGTINIPSGGGSTPGTTTTTTTTSAASEPLTTTTTVPTSSVPTSSVPIGTSTSASTSGAGTTTSSAPTTSTSTPYTGAANALVVNGLGYVLGLGSFYFVL